MTKIIELIYTETLRGNGTEERPFRTVPQLWTKDGQLVAEDDGNHEGYTINLQGIRNGTVKV